MKRLKFLPTILMLVLCVGVLAIGIYAITPSKNTIDGTITIGASPAEVQIDCYVGDSTGTPTTYESVRSGMTWTPAFEMGTGDANTQAEIPYLQQCQSNGRHRTRIQADYQDKSLCHQGISQPRR